MKAYHQCPYFFLTFFIFHSFEECFEKLKKVLHFRVWVVSCIFCILSSLKLNTFVVFLTYHHFLCNVSFKFCHHLYFIVGLLSFIVVSNSLFVFWTSWIWCLWNLHLIFKFHLHLSMMRNPPIATTPIDLLSFTINFSSLSPLLLSPKTSPMDFFL